MKQNRMKPTPTEVQAILDGEIRAAASLMRQIEDESPWAREMLKKLFPHTGKAHVVGITGPPGVGKSTLVDRLITYFIEKGLTVGVLAVDPTSPVSGGAILGDRVRMQQHASDARIFIRSLASRGHVGGLSQSAYDMVTVLDAMGKDIILVETVGVGQDAVEISELADTNLLVTMPGMGDGIQAMKAGILETASIIVVNKMDLYGAEAAVADMKALLLIPASSREGPFPLVLAAEAVSNRGIDAVGEAICKHRDYATSSAGKKIRKASFLNALKEALFRHSLHKLEQDEKLDSLFKAVETRQINPITAAENAIKTLFPPGESEMPDTAGAPENEKTP